MSFDCDCAGNKVASVVIPDAGILPSRDICILDQACVDLVGFRQLIYMKELRIGNDKYKLIN